MTTPIIASWIHACVLQCPSGSVSLHFVLSFVVKVNGRLNQPCATNGVHTPSPIALAVRASAGATSTCRTAHKLFSRDASCHTNLRSIHAQGPWIVLNGVQSCSKDTTSTPFDRKPSAFENRISTEDTFRFTKKGNRFF